MADLKKKKKRVVKFLFVAKYCMLNPVKQKAASVLASSGKCPDKKVFSKKVEGIKIVSVKMFINFSKFLKL